MRDGWKIGNNLRWMDEDGELRYVIHNHTLLKTLGYKKLPSEMIGPFLIGDTWVISYSREAMKQASPHATRPHRLHAKCNKCGKWIPVGRFGQHLGLNPIRRRPLTFAKSCVEVKN